MNTFKNIIPGLLLTTFIALLSIYFSKYIAIGSIAIAIIVGFILNNLFSNKFNSFEKGISFSEQTILSFAIILLGSYIDIKVLNSISIYTILLLIVTIIVSIILCYLIGKTFGLSKNLSLLLGVGNGICGSSAIAGTSKIINAKDEEIGISIAIINGLGAICIFVMPFFLLNILYNFSNQDYGFIIGSTVQAFGQVTATGFLLNQEVGEFATIIKMIRIIMLGPFLIILNLFCHSGKKGNKNLIYIPKFILGFILLAGLVSLNILPEYIILILKKTSKILLTIAMAGIGLKISFKSIFKFGFKPLVVTLFSFILQILFIIIFLLFF
mgnify:CR=1 FL=1